MVALLSPGSCAWGAGVIQRRLQIVNISWGTRPNDAVGMHVAAWVLGETMMHLATIWTPSDVMLAADYLRKDIIIAAEAGGLQAQAYWLSTTLALGAFLKVTS